ncbi:hypothetical protein THF1A12_300004 [Vibrio jasicida]|uniref:Transposase IS4-like domain-containing protein n=1 Tax=Vibrio jasicida TaxID=766224 RepID=A0AAU9QNR3_9VIBR|nr:hypothetical protein THF1A12_300004 [Vibrio jasicida]
MLHVVLLTTLKCHEFRLLTRSLKIPPKQLVRIDSKRVQIEKTFRDLNELGLRHSRTSNPDRCNIMFLNTLILTL